MTLNGDWTPGALAAIDAADELEITAERVDGTRRRPVPIWVVQVGGAVFVRTWHRRDTGWYGAAVTSGRAEVRLPGATARVSVEQVDDEGREAIDSAYRAKYARYGTPTVARMTGDEAAVTTLRLTPLPEG